jgi:hypothetical protein
MGAMRRTNQLGTTAALCLAISGGVVLGGCGSQTKTVSVANSPTVAQTSTPATTSTQSTTPATTTSKTPTTSTPAQTTTNGGTSAPSTTRTAPEPEFTQHESHAEGLSAAAELVRAKGYTPNETSQYHPSQTLRVLVGTRTGSSTGMGQQAFFFVGGRYLGTDTKEASAAVTVVAQSDTEITLGYPRYRAGDAPGSPSGGQVAVRYQLNNGKLTAIGKVP